MNKKVLAMGASLLLLVLAIPVLPGAQLEKLKTQKLPNPVIISISQSFYPMAINLILNGNFFPPKTGSGNIRRNIRLISMSGAVEGGVKAYPFYAGETGNWTATRIDDLLGFSVLAGRKYRIGLVEFEAPGPNIKTLISNEVEFLLLMNIDKVTRNPVPYGTIEIEAFTANELGPQGLKIAKLGGIQAPITQWGAPGPLSNFKIRIPHGLTVPGIYDLYVEENGVIVSRKVQVRLLPPKQK
jgi:hypothetical protein